MTNESIKIFNKIPSTFENKEKKEVTFIFASAWNVNLFKACLFSQLM